jgi:hypothetical protein
MLIILYLLSTNSMDITGSKVNVLTVVHQTLMYLISHIVLQLEVLSATYVNSCGMWNWELAVWSVGGVLLPSLKMHSDVLGVGSCGTWNLS